ncbi:ER membrane protein complex subunit 1 isoform X2 [Phlebotomus argentipes]|uniref:ER membrane protein complex subunit 1 isoform X2 n=1 Tax=Phlebotomus argentipes TaxID=94469 RepID=UPI002892B4BD|nr:ER membrane protein complex subunit 1 isoform X2 [Phlebotomus argentipes]
MSRENVLLLKSVFFLSVLTSVCCLYEDQIGKFDWRRSFVGKLQDGFFDSVGNDLVLVTAEEGVVAGLSAKTGDIVWRQVLERSPRGDIKHAALYMDTQSAPPQSTLLTVTGHSPALIRGWNPTEGLMMWEWSLTSHYSEHKEDLWFTENLMLYHVIPFWESHIEVTQYYAATGQQMKPGSSKISAAWLKKDKCVLAQPFIVCAIENQVIGVNLVSDNGRLFSKTLPKSAQAAPMPVPGLRAAIFVNNELISLEENSFSVNLVENSNWHVAEIENKQVFLQSVVQEGNLKIIATDLVTGQSRGDVEMTVPLPDSLGTPTIKAVKCRRKTDSQPLACRILLDTEDNSIVLLQQGKVKWTREEALSHVVAVEMVDLPLSDDEGAIEDEFNSKDGDFFGAIARRLTSQVFQVKNLFLTVLGLGSLSTSSRVDLLVRDSFGLHKMIVLLTASGKLYGIDNISGKVHWTKFLPEIEDFTDNQSMKLIIQRTAKHFPHPAQYAVVGKQRNSQNGIMYQFNPVTGEAIQGGIVRLSHGIQQMTVLNEVESENFLRALLILDENDKAHVLPDSEKSQANEMFLYTVKTEGIVKGYHVEADKKDVTAKLIWKVDLSGASNSHVIDVAGKNPTERVHSQGRVLSDRSVLYKYVNPNLVAVATFGLDSIHKYVINVHLIDVVSGSIVITLTHRRARGPLHMVHSENWLVYSYYNDKVRRTEITTIELYEGKIQANSTVWSSLSNPPIPMIERQSYIIPANVFAMKETITEKGITNKDVLIGLSTGAIVEMPWALLDPRRPVTTTQNQAREEGVIPYIPELPLPSESVINYNQSIARIRGIYTAPSGLESTCLVIVHGLDMFVTRVAPSKTFDLLKEDFDYFLISIVLLGLTVASYVVKHLASRKAVKQAWK